MKYMFFTLFLFGIFVPNAYSQNKVPDQKIQETISKEMFLDLVNQSIKLLENKKLDEIKDFEHIQIIMCINTIKILKSKLEKETICEKLLKLEEEKDYGNQLSKNIYTDCIPNRGMGFYYTKIKIELNGAPSKFAWYNLE